MSSKWQSYIDEDYDAAGFTSVNLEAYKSLADSMPPGAKVGGVVAALNFAFKQDGIVAEIKTAEDFTNALQAFDGLNDDNAPRR